MNARLKQYVERVDAMSLRERVLIFIMVAAALVALAVTGGIDPLSAKQKQLKQNLTQTQAQTQALETQIQALAEASKHDPDAPNKMRLADLAAKQKAAYAELVSAKQGLVSPDKMTQVLRDLLGRNPQLTLVSIKTLAPRSLMDSTQPTDMAKPPEATKAPDLSKVNNVNQLLDASAPAQTAKAETKPKVEPKGLDLGLYKHGVEISIEGSYADLVSYLAGLEQLPWRMFWGGVTLKAQTFPVSRLTLTVYTLSLDKTWLSV